jgi:hypothetical protein
MRNLAVGMVAVALGLVFGCSGSDDEESTVGAGPPANGNANGNAGSGAGDPGDFFGGEGGKSDGPSGSCAAEEYTADQQPLDMYVMLDKSGSMGDGVGGGTKWQQVTSALGAFLNQPGAAGIGVGIQYFPLAPGATTTCPQQCLSDTDCGACGPCVGAFPQQGVTGICLGAAGSGSCNAADYAAPAVPIAPLPGVAGDITASIANHGPNGGTPTSAALQGAIDYADAWADSSGHQVIAVLATDGEPTECDPSIPSISAIAASGLPKVSTFVIGVGASLGNLNAIAQAGGTGAAFIVDANANVQQQFLASGEPDYGSVNVEYTPGGGVAQLIPQVADAADCPADGNGWHYNDPNAPSQVVLCDGMCDTVSGDELGTVEILLGCATIVK